MNHLRLHGVNVAAEQIEGEEMATGAVLADYVRSRAADILVVGAYGHSRMRDFILGGVTKTLLAQPPMPIFLSH
jgi:nucleotide-binding universal stress UspA family protein